MDKPTSNMSNDELIRKISHDLVLVEKLQAEIRCMSTEMVELAKKHDYLTK